VSGGRSYGYHVVACVDCCDAVGQVEVGVGLVVAARALVKELVSLEFVEEAQVHAAGIPEFHAAIVVSGDDELCVGEDARLRAFYAATDRVGLKKLEFSDVEI
jgi:hypothetical protein